VGCDGLFPVFQTYPTVYMSCLPFGDTLTFPVVLGNEIHLFGLSLSLWNGQILPNLRILYLEDCTYLVEFPEMPLVEEMTIKDCPEFVNIPFCSLLQELNVISCGNVKDISYCPLLKKAGFRRCPSITSLSSCAHTTSLEIYECDGIVDCASFRHVSVLKLVEMKGVTVWEGIEGTMENFQANIRRSIVLNALPQIQEFSCCRFIYQLGLVNLSTLTTCDGTMYIHDLVIASCDNLTTTKGLKYIGRPVSILTCSTLTNLADLRNIPQVIIDFCDQLTDFSGLKNLQKLFLHGDACKASFEKFQKSQPVINKEIEQIILELPSY
jgi:hypothetical protein